MTGLTSLRSPEIELWFEFASNCSYLSVMRIEAEAKRLAVGILWRPFLLGPIFRYLGHGPLHFLDSACLRRGSHY